MKILVHAPFLAILGGLVAAMALSHGGATPATLFLTPLFTVAIALFSHESYAQKSKRTQTLIKGQWAVLALVVSVAFLCGLRGFVILSRSGSNLNDESRFIQTQGVVSLVRPWGRFYIAVIDTPEGGFLVNLGPLATIVDGMNVSVDGYTNPLRHDAKSDSGFDEWLYWSARGVTVRLRHVHIKPIESHINLHALRYAITRALAIHIPTLTSSYLQAAWTGQRYETLNKKHRAWGTSHLLAVSGFHVGLAVACGMAILRVLKCKRWTFVALSCVMWAYVLLTGAAPSAIRAGLMFQVAFTGELLGRPNSSLNSVSVAAVLLLMHSPFLFWDIGWRLSVLAAMTLTAMNFRGFGSWLLMSPLISLVSYPQVAWTFERIPLVGLVLNLFAPTFFVFGFTLASLGAVLKLVGLPFASFLLLASEGGFKLWESFADWLATIIPFSITWNVFLSWLGVGTLMFLLCRAVRFSITHTALLVPLFSLAAFWLFM